MKIIFATNNKHKIEEIKLVVPQHLSIITLKEAGIDIDIPEPYNTLEENARAKAKAIYEMTKTCCFSEDTGLEIEALKGEPGVLSARYAGEEKNDTKNIEKVLKQLEQKPREARFRTIIYLIMEKGEFMFEGTCNGRIATEPSGSSGFGYDPIFIPEGSFKCFAEMTIEEKNSYSHRRKATDKLVVFLNNLG